MSQRTPDLRSVPIVQGAAGTTAVVAAVANKKIVVVNYTISMSAAGTAKFRSGAATDITGAMNLGANGGASPNVTPDSELFETNVGEALNIITTGGAANGHLVYRLSEV